MVVYHGTDESHGVKIMEDGLITGGCLSDDLFLALNYVPLGGYLFTAIYIIPFRDYINCIINELLYIIHKNEDIYFDKLPYSSVTDMIRAHDDLRFKVVRGRKIR